MITINTSVLGKLKAIDWTFPKHSSNGHITSLHPYPARFIPKIPRTLLESLKIKKGLCILDPFAGCGTTLCEGIEQGNKVIGIDVNPLAVLLQRVYTYPYKSSDLDKFSQFYKKMSKSLLSNNTQHGFAFSIPNIQHWFNKEAIVILSNALKQINNENISEELRDLSRFSLSRIIVKISNQQSDTQYRAINKKLDRNSIANTIIDSFRHVEKSFRLAERNWKNKAIVIHGDARNPGTYKNINDIDVVITSPPYPNAYEYWLYHKYRMYWFNLDPLWSRKYEIGARPYYSGNGKLTEDDFQKDMEQVFENLYNISHSNTVQFWVIGDSIIKGRLIDNTQIINKACAKHGWKIIEVIKRNLVRSKSSFQGIGRQKKEELLVIIRNDKSSNL